MAGQPPPDAPPESVVLDAFSGLKNTVTPERLAADELEVALNVDLSDVGQVSRRRGYDRKSTGAFHSVWECSWGTLGVKDGYLGLINPDYSFRSTGLAVAGERLAYTQVADDVYFASSVASGIVGPNLTPRPWGQLGGDGQWVSPVSVPTEYLGLVRGKLLRKVPFATALTYYNGRIYLAAGNLLWWTELYLYTLVDATRNFAQFESEITNLGTVNNGVYVGTEKSTFFLGGDKAPLKRDWVVDEHMYPGSMIRVDATAVLPKLNLTSKGALMYMSNGGISVALDGGLVIPMTAGKVVIPDALSVAALFREQDGVSQYVGVADHGGTPVSNTRIGDYVEAEIRRRGA